MKIMKSIELPSLTAGWWAAVYMNSKFQICHVFLKSFKYFHCLHISCLKGLCTSMRELKKKCTFFFFSCTQSFYLSIVLKQQLASEAVAETRKNVENFRSEYDNLQAEDKYLDKAFRREFNDVSALQVDLLYKQFKRRPRLVDYTSLFSFLTMNCIKCLLKEKHQCF